MLYTAAISPMPTGTAYVLRITLCYIEEFECYRVQIAERFPVVRGGGGGGVN